VRTINISTPKPFQMNENLTILDLRDLREPSITEQNKANESLAASATTVNKLSRIIINNTEYVKEKEIWNKRERRRSFVYRYRFALYDPIEKSKY
jgi:hypothetical protein